MGSVRISAKERDKKEENERDQAQRAKPSTPAQATDALIGEARRMVQDRSEWWGFVRGMHRVYPGG